jgi:hypothetical protein
MTIYRQHPIYPPSTAEFSASPVHPRAGNKPSNVINPRLLSCRTGMLEGKAAPIYSAFSISAVNTAGPNALNEWSSRSMAPSRRRVADPISLTSSFRSHAPDIGFQRLGLSGPRTTHDQAYHCRSSRRKVDLVFEPAADGRILQALSTYFQSHTYPIQGERITMTPVQEPTPNTAPPIPAPEVDPWLPAMASIAASQMIAGSGLPGASQDRLRAHQYATPADVTAAIDEERQYLAALAAANVVQIGGQAPRGANIQAGMDGIERLQLALEALINGSLPPSGVAPLTGIREAYMPSGDYEMTGLSSSVRQSPAPPWPTL